MADLKMLDIAETISSITTFNISTYMSVRDSSDFHISVRRLKLNRNWVACLERLVTAFAPTIYQANIAQDSRLRYYVAQLTVLIHEQSSHVLQIDDPDISLDVAEAVLSDCGYQFNGGDPLYATYKDEATCIIRAQKSIALKSVDLEKLLKKRFYK